MRQNIRVLYCAAAICIAAPFASARAANSPPAILGPSAATIDENSSGTGITGLSVTDPDAGSGQLKLTLVATSGTLSLTVPGQSIAPAKSITFFANQTDASTGLASLQYTPDANFLGSDTIVITADDQGNTGGPAQSTTKNIAVSVVLVNHPPSITPPSDTSTLFNTATAALPFTVDDQDTGASSVVMTGSSDAPAVVPASAITFGGTSSNRTVMISPTNQGSGIVTITLTATDPSGDFTTATFRVTIAPNTPPTISGLGDQTVFEGNSATQTFTVNDLETPLPNLLVTAQSDNPSLVMLTISGNTLTLTCPPVGFGTAHVTVTVTDSGGLTASEPFVFTVIHVNHAPVLDPTATPTLTSIPVNALSGVNDPGTPLPQFLQGPTLVDADLGDQLGIAVTQVDTSHGSWFFSGDAGVSWNLIDPNVSDTNATLLTSNANTSLQFVPNPGFTGSASFKFRGWDGSDHNACGATGINVAANGGNSAYSTGTLTGQINVVQVNTPPSFTISADPVTSLENTPYFNPTFITNISPGLNAFESSQLVTFTITSNSNPALFAVEPLIIHGGLSTNANLIFVPATNQVGSAVIKVQAHDDGGTALGGIDTSAELAFTIVITPVNQAPTFTLPSATAIVGINSGPASLPGVATNISAGPPNESSQTVAFTLTSNSNPALFAVPPALSPTGTLTFTPQPNAYGSALVKVLLMDDGGTLDGGVDTSAPQFLTIVVAAAPVAVNGTISVAANATGSGIFTGSDPLNSPSLPLTFNIITNGTLGTATLVDPSTGAFTYTPKTGMSGLDTIVFSVTNGYVNSNLATEFIFVTNPTINSPFATPNPATIAAHADGTYAQVTFTGMATDTVNAQTLTYTWDFGDGAFGSGSSVVHRYVTAGIFAVTVSVKNSNGQTVSAALSVTVFAGELGTGPDSDNDGFSDTLETAYGSNPQSGASKPPGDPTAPQKLNIERLDIGLSFAKPKSDSITLMVLTPFPTNIAFKGQRLAVDVGGNVMAFTLDENLRAKTSAGTLVVSIDHRFKVFRFVLTLKKGAFATSLASYGLTTAATKKATVTVPVTVLFGGSAFTAQQTLNYQSTGKTAKAKVP